jgi:hypothetical protein
MIKEIAWIAAIAALCAIMLALSLTAAARKGPTYDEPLHLVGAWVEQEQADFRINPEDPPLWKRLATAGMPDSALTMDPSLTSFQATLERQEEAVVFAARTLFQNPSNDGHDLVQTSRRRMAILGPLLVLVAASWAKQLAGRAAAVFTAALLGLDPNLIGHAALVKNDVAFTLSATTTFWFTWRLGARLGWWNALGTVAGTAACLLMKFSGVLILPIVIFLLVFRVFLPTTWAAPSGGPQSRTARLARALVIGLVVGIGSFVAIWMGYGFRYDPTPSAGVRLAFDQQADKAAVFHALASEGRPPESLEAARAQQPRLVRLLRWIDEQRLLPSAWTYGFLHTYAGSLLRPSFFLGVRSDVGSPWYFPFAYLVKEPIALIGLTILGLGFGLARRRNLRASWAAWALGFPAAVYLFVAMRSNLNIGVRHVFPILPLLAVAAGAGLAGIWRNGGRFVRWAVYLLLIGLAVECLIAFPNYLAHFNIVAGGPKGGIRLLGDSNLDWGQDLPALRDWQRDNPGQTLYLSYFGTADPAFYGIRAIHLENGYFLAEQKGRIEGPGVLAISATHLQGIYTPPWQGLPAPFADLGGTIYLYRIN